MERAQPKTNTNNTNQPNQTAANPPDMPVLHNDKNRLFIGSIPAHFSKELLTTALQTFGEINFLKLRNKK